MSVESPVRRPLGTWLQRAQTVETQARSSSGKWVARYRASAVLLDVGSALVALIVAVLIGPSFGVAAFSAIELTVTAALAPLMWVLCLAQAGAYESRVLGSGTEEYAAIPRAVVRLLAVAAVGAAIAFDALPPATRLLVLVGTPVAVVSSSMMRYALRKRLHRSRIRHREAMQRTVVLGAHEAVSDLVDDFRRDLSRGILPVAACTSDPGRDTPGLPVKRPLDQALDTVDDVDAEVVVVAHPSGLTPTMLRRLSWALEQRDVELMISPGIMEVAGPRLSIRPSESLSLVHVDSPKPTCGQILGKTLLDRLGALLLLTLLSPVFALIAIAIAIDSKGGVIFRQSRVGAGGNRFTMLKFRTMVPDAEKRLDEVRGQADAGNDVMFKRTDDPRVTRVGRILRRYSLDELPQLFNVLTGDMSLVGPRPPLPREVAAYESDAIRRLRVRPGLTGLWQVSGRSDLSWDESLRLDLRYVDNWSVMFDLQILWRTVRAVVQGEGAY